MKILAISMAYPPLAYPRSIQVARLLKHSRTRTVLFCADEPEMRVDVTIEPNADAGLLDCIRIPVRKTKLGKIINRISSRYAPNIWNHHNLAPDQYQNWRPKVVDATMSYIKSHQFQPDAIVSFAQPFSDHLIGREIKMRLSVPWMAHFSDPWVDNPFAKFDEKIRKINVEMEQEVAESADILAFTAVETVDLFCKKYPHAIREKARVLPQCYDPSRYKSGADDGEKITIRYLGNFYGHRTPRPLIEALKEIYAATPTALDDLVFELIGPGDADEIQRLTACLPAGLVFAKTSVDYQESLNLMSSADGLLIIDAPADVSVFLPSKLIDYIGSGQPVFGITPTGAAASLITELGGIVADPAQVGSVTSGLHNFIEDLRKRRAINAFNNWGTPQVRERYSAERIASAFDETLAAMLMNVGRDDGKEDIQQIDR